MRRLKILKTIIDFLWITSMPVLLILIVAIPGIFFTDDLAFFKDINDLNLIKSGKLIYVKLLTVLKIISYIFILVCVYYFKKILQEFSLMHIFTAKIVHYFSKMGRILFIVGIVLIVTNFSINLVAHSKFKLQFGMSSQLLCLCFGLFFEILSEIFRIFIVMKKENDLTI